MLELIVREPANKTKNTPLLFIHGAWHGAWCWDEHFLPYFAERGYVVYAPSLRGHGQSPGKEKLRWTSVKGYLADVAATVAKLPQPPIIIGHSMGGYLAQLVLGGNRDTIFTVDEVKATARAYSTEPHFFSMAHDMMLEDGWENVAEKMIEWLEERGIE